MVNSVTRKPSLLVTIRQHALRLLVVLSVLAVFGCAGGGGSGGGEGLGIEGTGFKVLIKGVLLDEKGEPVAAANIVTDDASAASDAQGKFTFETTVLEEERKPIDVSAGEVSGTVELEPITNTEDIAVAVVIEVDRTERQVNLQSQTVEQKSPADEQFEEDVDDVVDEIDEELGGDDEPPVDTGGGGSVDPELVDL